MIDSIARSVIRSHVEYFTQTYLMAVCNVDMNLTCWTREIVDNLNLKIIIVLTLLDGLQLYETQIIP